KTELEVVVNWRMIAIGGALAALLVAVPVAGFALFGGQQAEAPEPVVSSAPSRATIPQRAESLHVRFDPVALKALEPPARPPVKEQEPAPVAAPRPVRKVTAAARTDSPESAKVAPVAAAAPATSARQFKRLDYLHEFEALRHLRDVPEFDLDQSLR